MLARLLLNNDSHVTVTIFESESSIDFRSQGGTLDLHEKTGQAALKKAGLFDAFLKYARYDGEAFKIADKNLLCYITQQGSKGSSTTGRPEIDRPRLRELIFRSLPEGTIRWSKKLVKISDGHVLSFANDSTASGFDLIVGADGAWSKVRPLLSDARPYYSGIAGHSLLISNAEQQVPDLHKLVNRGNLFAFSDGKSIMAQQIGDGSINVATWATPFAGEGVDLAFQDAMKLAAAIKASHSSQELDRKVEAFERDMFQRATETQQLTYDMMTAMFFTPGAPREGIERYILRAVRGELGPWITTLLTPVVYV
ncbi:Tetracycline resistance protein from transposon Tn4351/Tn4400 [Cercospora beticola]|uniref:Tetracycline resistance protein from transposon Tn4351/Tn4400 n=1 Tax=Cercospora beticola TaxID=122368 RepID=A0A2G5I8B8_CERBT|nr:Tetracycline resistance protein from transposon Tn4351/Tn4400 [Cercospora beticola]PIB00703.1 Tetracycline resistance protein from transposon Tn4351/Tn4400 [Cercospora beticola]